MVTMLASLTILTFNLNYGLSGDTATLQAIVEADADIVCLQETNPGWERAIRSRLSQTYPHMKFHHVGAAGGMAVLSKHVLADHQISKAPNAWFPAWKFVVDTHGAKVQVLQVHLRPPVSDNGSFVSGYFTTRDDRERELAYHLSSLDDGLSTLVVGDFNERKGRATKLLKRRGLRDVLPMFQRRAKTWRWKVGRVTGQLDHIFADGTLEPTGAEVIHAGNSDHFPVLATFVLSAPATASDLDGKPSIFPK